MHKVLIVKLCHYQIKAEHHAAVPKNYFLFGTINKLVEIINDYVFP